MLSPAIDMAEIVVAPLAERLSEEEIAELAKELPRVGARLPDTDDGETQTLARRIDEDVLAEFWDRLDSYDAACDVYLPVEFEGRLEIGDIRVGSAPVLAEILEELRDEFGAVEEDEDAEDEPADDEYRDPMEGQLKNLWGLVMEGAQAAVDRKLALFLKTE
ncbi:MAG TPA: hypothetical protein VKE22_26870 [Haliangiales bacterium]|nr:hypothetical protein [Haliangiales bacterium]